MVLAACLLLGLLGLATSAGLRLFGAGNDPAIPHQLPLPEPFRLPIDAITVVAPTDDRAAPASGVTGTTTLPTLPVPAPLADRIVAGERGIAPARPFSTAAASAMDRGRALQCLAAAIYYEAGSETDAGQQAVAQVVLNRVRHPAFPATVCGVVYQGSAHAGCQFSFACDGAMARAPSAAGWARATRAAAAALAGRVFAPVGLATHYHTYAVTPSWNRSLVMTDVVGTHFFHRWKGYWGTATAFSQQYRGGEPIPGPQTPATPTAVAAPVPIPAIAPLPALTQPVTAPTAVTAARRDSDVSMVMPKPASRDEPDDSQILPQWRDSGKPLHP